MPLTRMDIPLQQNPTLHDALFECERRLIIDTLIEVENHRVQEAKCLGISRATLYRKLKAHGLTEPRRSWWEIFASRAAAEVL